MAVVRFILFILVISVAIGLIAKYIILFLKKAKKIEEKAYDKLEEKVFPKSQKKKK